MPSVSRNSFSPLSLPIPHFPPPSRSRSPLKHLHHWVGGHTASKLTHLLERQSTRAHDPLLPAFAPIPGPGRMRSMNRILSIRTQGRTTNISHWFAVSSAGGLTSESPSPGPAFDLPPAYNALAATRSTPSSGSLISQIVGTAGSCKVRMRNGEQQARWVRDVGSVGISARMVGLHTRQCTPIVG